MARAVEKGSNSVLLPQTLAAIGRKSWLSLSVLPAFPWHAPPLIVGWEALGPTESEGD